MKTKRPLPRGAAATIVVALLLAALAAPAHAAPAVRGAYRFGFISCLGTTAHGGTVGLTLGLARFDTAVDLFAWDPGTIPYEDLPAVATDPDQPATLTWEGEHITGAAPVFDTASGRPLGEATFDVTATPDGEIEEFDGHTRDGNQVTRQSGAIYRAAVTGSVTFPGQLAVNLDECDGFVGDNAVFQNAPRAAISGTDVSVADCDLTVAGRRVLAGIDSHSAFLQEYDEHADPDVDRPLLFGAVEETAFPNRSLSATVPLFAPSDGEPAYVGDAQIDAAVKAGASTTTVLRFLRGHLRIKTTPLTLAGAVTMPDGRTYDLAGCTAYRQVIQVQAVQ